MYLCSEEKIDVCHILVSSELAQGLDTDKINPYIEKCFGIKKPLLTVSEGKPGGFASLASSPYEVQLKPAISNSQGKRKTVRNSR